MPTINQLPLATSVSATDLLPVSQGGTTRGLQVGNLLSSVQPAISLAPDTLLGRVSSTAGGPEAVNVGLGLGITSGALLATALDHTQLPTSSALGSADEVITNSGGAPMRLPAVLLRGLFAAGSGISIDGSGDISTVPATTQTLGAVKVGSGLTVGGDGTLATDNSALQAEFVTPAQLQTTVQAAIAAGAPSARQYGVKGDGTTDNLAALQSYINTVVNAGGGEILIPAGRYVVSGTLTATLTGNTTLVMRGAGADITELVFSNSTDGLVVTYSSNADYRRDTSTGAKLEVTNLSIVRGVSSVGNDGIRVVGDSRNGSGIIEPGTVMSGLVIRGTSAGGGWTNALVYQDVANTSTTDVTLLAANADTPLSSTGAGLAIRTTNGRFSTLHAIDGLSCWACNRGMDIYDHVQGIEIVNSNFTGGAYGIYWNSTSRQEQLSISTSQFSTLSAGIYCNNLQNVQVTNNKFYNQNNYSGAAGTWTAISLSNCDNCQIVANGVLGANSGTETGVLIVNDLAYVTPNRPNVISSNTFSSLLGAVLHVSDATTNVLFSGNNADLIVANPPVTVDAGCTVSCVSNQFAEVSYLTGFPGGAGVLAVGSTTNFAQVPTHPNPPAGDSSMASATTAFVQAAVAPTGTTVTSGSTYAMATTDRVVIVNKTAGSPTGVTLPAHPVTWAIYVVKDGAGDAASHPITITGSAAIDGSASFTLNSAYAAVSLVFNGVQWSVV